MKETKMILMDFSGIYQKETFYKQTDTYLVDCRKIQGTNCYCDEEAKQALRERVGSFGPAGVRFLDSGNYHYASLLWMEQINEPFELLVFDHHTDMKQPAFGDILSCGGWIRAALETCENLKRVYLAGPPLKAVEDDKREDSEPWERVVWISEEDLKGQGNVLEQQLKGSELPLYISVDKDILSPEDARTNWDQGELGLEELLCHLKQAASLRRIIGADVCGEDPEGAESDEGGTGIRINDRTNRHLAEVLGEHINCIIDV